MQKENRLKPFDLERALAGDPVVIRDRRAVTQLHLLSDAVYDSNKLVGVIEGVGTVSTWDECGNYISSGAHKYDLYMAPVKREVWVNLYELRGGGFRTGGNTFFSEGEAIDCFAPPPGGKYIEAVKIHEYEEL